MLLCYRYAAVGKLGNSIKVCDVVRLLALHKGLNLYVQAKFAIDTLIQFMASASEFITTTHVPTKMMHETKGLIEISHEMQMVTIESLIY